MHRGISGYHRGRSDVGGRRLKDRPRDSSATTTTQARRSSADLRLVRLAPWCVHVTTRWLLHFTHLGTRKLPPFLAIPTHPLSLHLLPTCANYLPLLTSPSPSHITNSQPSAAPLISGILLHKLYPMKQIHILFNHLLACLYLSHVCLVASFFRVGGLCVCSFHKMIAGVDMGTEICDGF